MDINFSGKTILVTGGGRGIGLEIVKLLSKLNGNIVALSKTSERLDSLKKLIPNIECICVDLNDWQATKLALEPYSERIDLLVNNAGYAKCTPLGEITEKEFNDQYNVNVRAIINVTQCVLPGMKKRRSGSIVNISSAAGLIGLRDHLVYGGTKAAVDSMTKNMALELGEYNIRVNSVNPGVTRTDMAMVGWKDPQRLQWMLDRCPLNRISEPEEIAQVVAYLLSDKSAMINAMNIPVEGGMLNTKM